MKLLLQIMEDVIKKVLENKTKVLQLKEQKINKKYNEKT